MRLLGLVAGPHRAGQLRQATVDADGRRRVGGDVEVGCTLQHDLGERVHEVAVGVVARCRLLRGRGGRGPSSLGRRAGSRAWACVGAVSTRSATNEVGRQRCCGLVEHPRRMRAASGAATGSSAAAESARRDRSTGRREVEHLGRQHRQHGGGGVRLGDLGAEETGVERRRLREVGHGAGARARQRLPRRGTGATGAAGSAHPTRSRVRR